jgi:hypothetical protein
VIAVFWKNSPTLLGEVSGIEVLQTRTCPRESEASVANMLLFSGPPNGMYGMAGLPAKHNNASPIDKATHRQTLTPHHARNLVVADTTPLVRTLVLPGSGYDF